MLQDGLVKQAKLPYTVVKIIRALQQNPDWEFELPFPHMLTLTAIGAGSKEVKYSLVPSPKLVEITPSVLNELAKKPSPREIVEKIKGGRQSSETSVEYPTEEIDPDSIPF